MDRAKAADRSNPLGTQDHNTGYGTGGAMVQFNTVYLPRIPSGHLPALVLGR
jgi:hypothetical protein